MGKLWLIGICVVVVLGCKKEDKAPAPAKTDDKPAVAPKDPPKTDPPKTEGQQGGAPAAGPVKQDCVGGGCDQTCAPNATCEFTCMGATCNQTCQKDAKCNMSCLGGSCNQVCNGPGCEITCGGGSCNQKCNGDCTKSCAGGSCS